MSNWNHGGLLMILRKFNRPVFSAPVVRRLEDTIMDFVFGDFGGNSVVPEEIKDDGFVKRRWLHNATKRAKIHPKRKAK